jgi:hypothetical protein
LAQILNTYVVLGSSRYTSICRCNISFTDMIFSWFSALLLITHCWQMMPLNSYKIERHQVCKHMHQATGKAPTWQSYFSDGPHFAVYYVIYSLCDYSLPKWNKL